MTTEQDKLIDGWDIYLPSSGVLLLQHPFHGRHRPRRVLTEVLGLPKMCRHYIADPLPPIFDFRVTNPDLGS